MAKTCNVVHPSQGHVCGLPAGHVSHHCARTPAGYYTWKPAKRGEVRSSPWPTLVITLAAALMVLLLIAWVVLRATS